MEEWLKKLWARIKSWWGAIATLSTGHLAHLLWEKLGNLDLLRDVLSWFGVTTDTIFTFLLGPWFALIMAATGIFGMVFLEKPDFKTKHPASQLVGASIFVIFASLIGGSLVFEKLLETPKFSEVADFYNAAHTQRHLRYDQRKKLVEYCKLNNFPKFANFFISSTTDNDSIRLARQIYDTFTDCGITNGQIWLPPSDQLPGQQGIMLETIDPNTPSKTAVAVTKAFVAAKIKFTPLKWPDLEGPWMKEPDFVIYVTPDTPAPP
jgi:hypothetical protein